MAYRILVVDDETDFAEAVAEYLGRLGHDAATAASGAQMWARLGREGADLVLLDLRLGSDDGAALLARLVATEGPAVIVMSGHAGLESRITLLDAGAQDVLAKPVALREVAARIGAVLRARRPGRAGLMRWEAATADLGAGRLVHDDGRVERLDAGEVALLRMFRDAPGRLLTRAEILERAPGTGEDALERAVDNRISRLRAKLGTAAIATVRGAGYRWDPALPEPGRDRGRGPAAAPPDDAEAP